MYRWGRGAFNFFFFLFSLFLRGQSGRRVVHKKIRTSEAHFVRSPRSAPFSSLACALPWPRACVWIGASRVGLQIELHNTRILSLGHPTQGRLNLSWAPQTWMGGRVESCTLLMDNLVSWIARRSPKRGVAPLSLSPPQQGHSLLSTSLSLPCTHTIHDKKKGARVDHIDTQKHARAASSPNYLSAALLLGGARHQPVVLHGPRVVHPGGPGPLVAAVAAAAAAELAEPAAAPLLAEPAAVVLLLVLLAPARAAVAGVAPVAVPGARAARGGGGRVGLLPLVPAAPPAPAVQGHRAGVAPRRAAALAPAAARRGGGAAPAAVGARGGDGVGDEAPALLALVAVVEAAGLLVVVVGLAAAAAVAAAVAALVAAAVAGAAVLPPGAAGGGLAAALEGAEGDAERVPPADAPALAVDVLDGLRGRGGGLEGGEDVVESGVCECVLSFCVVRGGGWVTQSVYRRSPNDKPINQSINHTPITRPLTYIDTHRGGGPAPSRGAARGRTPTARPPPPDPPSRAPRPRTRGGRGRRCRVGSFSGWVGGWVGFWGCGVESVCVCGCGDRKPGRQEKWDSQRVAHAHLAAVVEEGPALQPVQDGARHLCW